MLYMCIDERTTSTAHRWVVHPYELSTKVKRKYLLIETSTAIQHSCDIQVPDTVSSNSSVWYFTTVEKRNLVLYQGSAKRQIQSKKFYQASLHNQRTSPLPQRQLLPIPSANSFGIYLQISKSSVSRSQYCSTFLIKTLLIDVPQ